MTERSQGREDALLTWKTSQREWRFSSKDEKKEKIWDVPKHRSRGPETGISCGSEAEGQSGWSGVSEGGSAGARKPAANHTRSLLTRPHGQRLGL